MGFYSQAIFPWLCDLVLGTPAVGRHRQELLAGVEGKVLEIGFGTGLNLQHYPPHVRQLTTLDPSPGMRRRAQRRIRASPISVDQRMLPGESLPFEPATFDCVVSTFTLCSIQGVDRALDEVFRVLKPWGRFLFLEHGLSSEPNVQKWQRRLNGLQRCLAEGCHLTRDMRQLVGARPFSSFDLEEFYLPDTPKTHGYLYRGLARK